MKVTVKFNVLITLGAFIYIWVVGFFIPEDTRPSPLESLSEGDSVMFLISLVFFLGLSMAIGMYLTRSIWNILFPRLCGWKEISLEEAYALMIFFTITFYGS